MNRFYLGVLKEPEHCFFNGRDIILSYVPKKSVKAQTKKKDKSKEYSSTKRYSNISWTCLFCSSQMVMSGTETEVD